MITFTHVTFFTHDIPGIETSEFRSLEGAKNRSK